MRLLTLLIITLTAALTAARAQERPVTASWMAGAGYARLSDAYLAPFTTSGTAVTLRYERSQALASRPERWSRRLSLALDLSRTHTLTTLGSGAITGAAIEAEAGALCRLTTLPCGLSLAAGPSLFLTAGANYRASNGNNPVAAHAALTAGLTARASWPLTILRRPVGLSFTPSLELLGAFFSPDYGELYYEIYEGSASAWVHPAWPGNRLAYTHLLAADIYLGKTALRLGYLMRLSSEQASGLACNVARHSLVIGITSSFISVAPRRATLSQGLQYAL